MKPTLILALLVVLSLSCTTCEGKPKKKAGSPLTTHVLDTSAGIPARQLPVKVYYEVVQNGVSTWNLLVSNVTNDDGRVSNLLTQQNFLAGRYKISFDTQTYFNLRGITQYFYPYAEVVFIIIDPSQHYHVPLLLSPFGYSTYRGS